MLGLTMASSVCDEASRVFRGPWIASLAFAMTANTWRARWARAAAEIILKHGCCTKGHRVFQTQDQWWMSYVGST
jgi:hypothetical protein